MYPVLLSEISIPVTNFATLSDLESHTLVQNEIRMTNEYFVKNQIPKIIDIAKRSKLKYSNLLKMDSFYRGESIYYANHLDRIAKFQIFVYDQKMYDNDGHPINTQNLSFDEGAILVMDTVGNIFLAHKKRGEIHHSTFLEGRDVAYACMVEVKDGVKIKEELHSGHYLPTNAQQTQFHHRISQNNTIDYSHGSAKFPFYHAMSYLESLNILLGRSADQHHSYCQICLQKANAYFYIHKIRDVYQAYRSSGNLQISCLKTNLKKISENIKAQFDINYFTNLEEDYEKYTKKIVLGKFDELEISPPPRDPYEIRCDTIILFVADYFLRTDDFETAEKLLSCWGNKNIQFASHKVRIYQKNNDDSRADSMISIIKQHLYEVKINLKLSPINSFAQFIVSDNKNILNHVENYFLCFKLNKRQYYELIDAWTIHELTLVTLTLIDYCNKIGDKISAQEFIDIAKQFALPMDLPLLKNLESKS